ncbi:hypothetical protein EZV62_000924 [Acer yangbiense]|uniref:COP1-interacting protein 7 n=1 Tax=Acer yangbiense TaxID=1000413 RepID=A0A5C7IT30_9ROSI|nr:hypothetical protein EZV62_000924 [Acer yangbiense]
MKSSTRLDSVVFQLTPTRTRCDLVILANGKTEKIASGLLNPFLAHLKTAQDQMAKGGYTIILEPEHGNDVTWFTKGTVERFVRFVSTPEVLERVYTIESEILQIEEAIAIQSNNEIGLSTVEEIPAKPVESIEGNRPLLDTGDEKAIVLYKPGAHPPEANGSAVQEGNSKVQLLKVLETRKTVLQKEQGMAFARAVAAGFDVDNMAPLKSFAESFGALRLKDACVKFVELWKRKHETGQWFEIEEAEAMSSQADFAALNASGIMLSAVVNKQKDEASENNGKADDKLPTDHHPIGHQEYFQGQFPHNMFPPWPIHSPPGAPPAFQGYPMQGVPYYQNYPANGPYFQPPYPSMEDPRCNSGQRIGRRHSMDSSNTVLETWEMDGSKARSQDDVELDKETSGKKASRSGKKQSGMVVIRNINYITSKRQDSSASESQSASNSEPDDEDEDIRSSTPEKKHNGALRSSKRRESHIQSDMEGTVNRKQEDGGQWQAFQNYILKDADEEERAVDKGMFAMERDIRARRRQNTVGDDPLLSNGRDMGEYHQGNVMDVHKVSGKMARMPKASSDELLISGRLSQSGDVRRFVDGQMDLQSTEIDGKRGVYRTTNDDFIIHRRENQSGIRNSTSDMLPVNGFEGPTNNLDRRSPQNMDDDSYIMSLRSLSLDHVEGNGRNAIDMDVEVPTSRQKTENNQVSYEPDELSLMPERGPEKRSNGYDPALDYEIQAHGASLNKKKKDGVTDVKQVLKKSDKNQKSKLMDASDKKKTVGPIRKGKPSKLSPLEEARARAEKLRTYKADLQKMKKQKEEEEVRRLEALKIKRQQRISARGSSIPAQSPLPSQQTRKQLPTKLSPSAHRSSKFSDSEPGSSSPLQRLPVRAASLGSSDFQKVSKPSKMNAGSHSGGNRISRSISSLPEPKKENSGVTPDAKVSMARIRRLSEPKISSSQHISSAKPRSAEPISKSKASDGSENKKISAIMNHDKNKVASLPELKVRKSKEAEVTHSKSVAKESTQKVNGTKSSTSSEGTEQKKNKEKISHHNDVDDNLVIEKTVVMLEEKPSVSAAHTREKNEVVSDYVAVHVPMSSLTIDGVDKEPIEHQLQEQPATAYVVTNGNSGNTVKESLKTSSINVSEKQYQAPYARVSSLEDPCTKNSEYGRAPPMTIQTVTTGTDVVKAQVSDSKSLKLEKIPEALDKPQSKESKGFRRLLKFGKRNHSSSTGDRGAESDNVSFNGSEADDVVTTTASASEVHTLKNLISQDETSTATTTQKCKLLHASMLHLPHCDSLIFSLPQPEVHKVSVTEVNDNVSIDSFIVMAAASRSFSLLSPFRSKEKKMSTT